MDDPICRTIERWGIVSSNDCLRCEVCCRFPLAGSPLAPHFSNAEREAAVAAGMPGEAFPPGRYGPGDVALLEAEGPIFRCPAFRPRFSDCAIYARRPLDCRLYPFMLMFDRMGREVALGVDTYCPAATPGTARPALAACASELAALLDGAARKEALERRGIVGGWKEHVLPLAALPGLTRELCRTDLGLARLVSTAAPELARCFEAHQGRLSYHAFAPVYVWSDIFDLRWKTSGERLLIFAEGEGDCFLICPPLGSGDAAGPAEEAVTIMRRLSPDAVSPRIQEADAETAKTLSASGWRIRDTSEEYLYSRSALAALAGNRYEKKRQLCNRFEREHAWTWRAFTADDFAEAVALHRKWLENRRAKYPQEFYAAQAEASSRCVHRALRDAESIGLVVRVLEVNGRIAGFTAGCPLPDGRTFCVLLEVSDLAVRGAAQVTFREFCRELRAFDLINAGGASGLPNLARVKESYRPELRLPCHTLVAC